MENSNLGTVNNMQITQEMLDSYVSVFERDWTPSEVKIVTTERGKALQALHSLNIPLSEIEALERKAKRQNLSLRVFIHSILQNELLTIRDLE